MRAIGVIEYGGPEALREVELEQEPLGPDEVRIAVTHAAVSPTDTLVRNGARAEGDRAPDVADVPGMDVAGRVVDLGTAVGERDGEWLSIGDPVMGIVVPSGQHGAYRTDLVLPFDSVAPVPDGASGASASTLPMNGLTAWLALDQLGLEPGQTLAVTGAAGAFGGYVVQLAKVRGLRVVADAAETDRDLVAGFGADVVVERGDGFADAVLREVPDGVDGLADGALLGEKALPAVRDGGAVATVRGYEGDGSRGLRVTPVWVRDAARRRDALEELRALASDGRITLRVADVLPAGEAAEAHRRLEAGGVRGRLVLDFS
ncbi:NADP-dependent oxidoreductase [Nocardioides sp. AX2bis]|uniref:NADP-dependent oxidoreductase n=1 Tax=Nocardioides sp. AX2bis TaxID=2653157 RepID=UPI0012F3A7FF|nr:NADP-dependent oxidoreductase [Nocardioides sp. AX2bis]VXC08844.1 Alcohol dehydrogenase [Nocardioides sp. AX2bis]